MKEQERLNLKDLAERIFVTRKHVYNLVEAGMPRAEDGSFVWKHIWDWFQNRADLRALAAQSNPEAFAAAELKKMQADADWKRTKADALAGKLVDVAFVEQLQSRINGNVRNRILALPARLSPQVVGVTNRAKIHKILTDEVHQCLGELVDISMKTVDDFEFR